MGEGVLLLGVLFEHFSIDFDATSGSIFDATSGSIFDAKLSVCSRDLVGADSGLILLVWVGFLNPKDDANPLVDGSCFF